MKKVLFLWLTVPCFALEAATCHASAFTGQDSSVLINDDIRFEATRFDIDSTTRTATVELLLTNLKEQPRELKLNVYGTQLVDNERNAYYFSTMTLGRVLIRFEDKQNYMHYLLQPDTGTKLTITAAKIPANVSTIQVVKIVFEDSEEEGRFLDAYLTATDSESAGGPSGPSDPSSF